MKKKLLRPIAICLGFFVGRKELSLFEFVKEWRLGLRRVRDFFLGADNFKMGIDGRGGAVYN